MDYFPINFIREIRQFIRRGLKGKGVFFGIETFKGPRRLDK